MPIILLQPGRRDVVSIEHPQRSRAFFFRAEDGLAAHQWTARPQWGRRVEDRYLTPQRRRRTIVSPFPAPLAWPAQVENNMNTFAARAIYWILVAISSLALINPSAIAQDARERNAPVRDFTTLPDGVRFPEGITANPATGEIYVGTFDFGPNANKLLRFDRRGQLLAQRDFGGMPLLGLAFDAASGKVYICNFGAGKIQRIAAAFDSATPVEDVASLPHIGAPAPRSEGNPDGSADTITFGSNSVAAPNGLVFDSSGNLYVSDSFQGAVYKITNPGACAPNCAMTTVSHDPLLATAGFPPFGANGLALSGDQSTLFVANTGDDRVLKVVIASGAASVFAESINGADGLAVDGAGRLWVAANQNDEVVQLNANGRVVQRLGGFAGIRKDGTPEGLLFPASLVFVGDEMFVTNAALALTAAVGDEPEEDVTRYTISRIRVPAR
jgi:DNA-binding beta-propeller fold protein YncE